MSYDLDEVVKKFSGTTVLFEGVPVRIADVLGGTGDSIVLEYHEIPYKGGGCKKTYICNSGWDFTTLPSKIGYVHIENAFGFNAFYCMRVPIRQTRQGLDNETMRVQGFNVDDNPGWNGVIESSHFHDAVNQKFWTLKDAVDGLYSNPKRYKSIAVSKKFAVIWDMINPPNLLYRNERIGYVEDDCRIRLSPKKFFLREELTDMMGYKVYASK